MLGLCGMMGVVGVLKFGIRVEFDVNSLLFGGYMICGIVEGDSVL